ncbi:MAG: hypothetical protein NC122_04980 [Faecalibacterium sp.]|nr:hypothetical protein [Ruminococcus sp.]MCM1391885.1 hypothetical protein [Ruminococcus sp.]MCM1485539.1 hypothetical protein [Faecalibacterium sp.]
MANSLNGFIKLHRKLVAWGWYQDYVVKDVFLHLLLTANYKDTSWRDVTLKEGQVVTGTKKLADDLGFSRQQVRTALDKLKSTKEITIKATNKYSIITIVNWEDYQSSEEKATNTSTKSATNEQPTSNQQITNNQPQRKNNKNKRNKKEINKEKNSAASPAPPLRADRLADGEIDLHKFKPDGMPLPKALIDAGITWAEYLEIKNQ